MANVDSKNLALSMAFEGAFFELTHRHVGTGHCSSRGPKSIHLEALHASHDTLSVLSALPLSHPSYADTWEDLILLLLQPLAID